MLSFPSIAIALTAAIIASLSQNGHKAAAQQLESGGFRYSVNDQNGNEHSHQQTRIGNGVKGQYKVLLPDGRLQTVTYVADEKGYRAKVDYTPASPGEATTAGAGVPIAAASFSPATQPAVGGGIPGGYNGGSNIGIIPARAPTYAPAFAPSASAFYQGGGGGGLASKLGSGPAIGYGYGPIRGGGGGYGAFNNPYYSSIGSSNYGVGLGSYGGFAGAYLGGTRGTGPYGNGFYGPGTGHQQQSSSAYGFSNPIFGASGYPIGTSTQGSNGYSYGYATPFSQVAVYSNTIGGYGY